MPTKYMNIQISQEINANLDYLRKQLHSPKKWIIERLILEEVERVKARTSIKTDEVRITK